MNKFCLYMLLDLYLVYIAFDRKNETSENVLANYNKMNYILFGLNLCSMSTF
jgi:hypothetical protein